MSTQTVVYDDERGSGWATFAAVLMFAVGFFRIISAISYFANSIRVNNLTNGAFQGHLWATGSGTPSSPASRSSRARRCSSAAGSGASSLTSGACW